MLCVFYQEVDAEILDVETGKESGVQSPGSLPVSQPQLQPTDSCGPPINGINPTLAVLLEEDKEKYDLGPEEVSHFIFFMSLLYLVYW